MNGLPSAPRPSTQRHTSRRSAHSSRAESEFRQWSSRQCASVPFRANQAATARSLTRYRELLHSVVPQQVELEIGCVALPPALRGRELAVERPPEKRRASDLSRHRAITAVAVTAPRMSLRRAQSFLLLWRYRKKADRCPRIAEHIAETEHGERLPLISSRGRPRRHALWAFRSAGFRACFASCGSNGAAWMSPGLGRRAGLLGNAPRRRRRISLPWRRRLASTWHKPLRP